MFKQGGRIQSMFFCVAVDTKLPNGGAVIHDRRSRHIERLSVMRRVLKRIRRRIPEAYGLEIRRYR